MSDEEETSKISSLKYMAAASLSCDSFPGGEEEEYSESSIWPDEYEADVHKQQCQAEKRREIRISADNAWIVDTVIKKRINEWLWAELPPGRRLTVACWGGRACGFGKTDMSEIHPTITCADQWRFDTIKLFVFDAVVDKNNAVICVYDVIVANSVNVSKLPLTDRLHCYPAGKSMAKYHKAADIGAGNIFSVAARLSSDGYKSGAILFMNSSAPYNNSGTTDSISNTEKNAGANRRAKNAIIWKPPHPPGTCVLCYRTAFVMGSTEWGDLLSKTAADSCVLVSEGMTKGINNMPYSAPFTGGSDTGVILSAKNTAVARCYVCKYRELSDTWVVIGNAKRVDPLYTAEEVYMSKKGFYPKCSADIFSQLQKKIKEPQ